MERKQIAVIFIKNSEGDFFVHQRLSSKKSFPNKYGIGAGGHIESGEEPLEAAQRELFEETGLTSSLEFVDAIDFQTPEMDQIDHLFLTINNESIETDKTEWQWSGWMTKENVEKLYIENKLCPDTAVLWHRYLETEH